MTMRRWGMVLVLSALAVEVLLRTTALGAPVWEVRGRRDWAAGDRAGAQAALSKAAALSPSGVPGARLALARLHGDADREGEAGQLLEPVVAHHDPAVRGMGWHARSALYLTAAGRQVGPPALQSRARAADAAKAALRVRPDDAGVRWNLYLALPEEDGPGSGSDRSGGNPALGARTLRSLRSALDQVEARNLREGLAAIIGQLEAGAKPPPPADPGMGGPPW